MKRKGTTMKTEEFMPEYIMLIGLPGSGKSTWIKKHISENPDKDFKVVSSDDIIEEWGAEEGLEYGQAFEKFAKPAMKEMNSRFTSYVQAAENIIHDQTNMSVKSRKGKLAKAKDYRKIAVVFSLDQDEWQRRYDKRHNETGKTISGFVINNMRKSFQPPTSAEGFDEIINVTG